jgi:hypothetical protein
MLTAAAAMVIYLLLNHPTKQATKELEFLIAAKGAGVNVERWHIDPKDRKKALNKEGQAVFGAEISVGSKRFLLYFNRSEGFFQEMALRSSSIGTIEPN